MKTILAATNDAQQALVRRALLSAGLPCAADDCLPWEHLPTRLGDLDGGLLVLALPEQPEAAMRWLEGLQLPVRTTTLVFGPAAADVARAARALGAWQYLAFDELGAPLDSALDRLWSEGRDPRPRGQVVAVLAPTSGSGGTTLAVNLAAQISRRGVLEVALADAANEAGDVALWLDVLPHYGLHDVCARIDRLDLVGLNHCLFLHRSGLRLLAGPAGDLRSLPFPPAALGRVVRLLRQANRLTLLRLDRRIDEAQLAALRLADTVLLVMRPDVPAVKRARLTVEQIREAIGVERVRPVITRIGQPGELAADAIERALGLTVRDFVVDDPRTVNLAVNQGMLLAEVSPRSRIVADIDALASRVLPDACEPPRRSLLTRWLARWHAQPARGKAARQGGLAFPLEGHSSASAAARRPESQTQAGAPQDAAGRPQPRAEPQFRGEVREAASAPAEPLGQPAPLEARCAFAVESQDASATAATDREASGSDSLAQPQPSARQPRQTAAELPAPPPQHPPERELPMFI